MKACNQCGKCCTRYGNGGLSVTADEIQSWDIFKPDLYRYVRNGEIWMHPETGEQLSVCPWLEKLPNEEKYGCKIYYDRPNDCRYYPVTIEQMRSDDCEMLELRDLQNPKHAQTALDKLMADSRPPMG